MESELNGTTIVLKRLLEYLKTTVDDRNIEWVAARMIHGETAVSKLIDSKLSYTEPGSGEEPYLYEEYFVNQAAHYSIKLGAESHLGGEGLYYPGHFMDMLFYWFDHKVDDALLIACWLSNCHTANWQCVIEEYVDIRDGAKMRERKWLVCRDSKQRVTVKYVREAVSMEMYHRICREFQVMTKHLYLAVTLEEWVTAYNTDTGEQNDPEEIRQKMIRLLMMG